MGYGMWQWGPGSGWFGLLHLLVWAAVIVGVVSLIRAGRDRRSASSAGGQDRSCEILRERYARGEIDQGEFDTRMRHLRSGGARVR